MSEQRDLIVSVDDEPKRELINPTDRLIQMAIQGDADIEKLERLIDLKNREEERQAKRAFDTNFARMQSEFTEVGRSKQGYDYKYAPIEVLQKHYNPIISAHGFSYRWREEAIDGGKRCILTISGHGHSEENWFDVPQLEGTKQMNAVQVAGAMSTYGRRYTFIAGFGIIISDEDQDGTLDDGVAYAEYLRAIDAQSDVDALHKMVSGYRKELKEAGDMKGVKVVTDYYTRKRKELER